MLRPLLLFLSQSPLAKRFVLNFPLAKKVARRYVAGETLQDALQVTRDLTSQGLLVALDLLGENVVKPGAAAEATQLYLEMLNTIQAAGLDCYVSLKLTHLGLDEGPQVALENLLLILALAQSQGRFVRIDMEGSRYTEDTVAVFRQARERFDNVGIVIQAYLRRSQGDISLLNRLRGQVRICKGAYAEPPSVAYQSRQEVSQSMKDLVYRLLKDGCYPAIASHDEAIIEAALQAAQEYGLPPDRFEFQMLYGIRRERQLELSRMGYNVRVYVPFGSDWYAYFMRRLAERPANLIFFLTALLRG